MANEFTRITHFVSAGVTLHDVNPNKLTTGNINGKMSIGCGPSTPTTYIPCEGYKKFTIYKTSGGTYALYWCYSDGTDSQVLETKGPNETGWFSEYNIPDNAVAVKITGNYTSDLWVDFYVSMLS